MAETCVINNAYCTPRPCVGCGRVFCAHEHPERRAFGYYGQYCSAECQTAKRKQIWELGQTRFVSSRVVLVVEQEFCYLVLNKHKVALPGQKPEKPEYGFKILHESLLSPSFGGTSERLALDYCHYPGFSVEDYPVTYAMNPQLQIAISVYDEYAHSMWTIVGFRVLDGEIDTYGVGGHIEVIDVRKERRGKLCATLKH